MGFEFSLWIVVKWTESDLNADIIFTTLWGILYCQSGSYFAVIRNSRLIGNNLA